MSDLTPLVVIPARLASTRLPNKPLAEIGGIPMIVRVWRQAVAANVGPVIVACGDQEIFDAVAAHGGTAVMTDPDLPSGSDRVSAAADHIDPDAHHSVIVNLQGDLPLLAPHVIATVLNPLHNTDVDVATLACAIQDDDEAQNPNVVKVVSSLEDTPGAVAQALYFTRATAPTGPGPLWHHIGIYAYRRTALTQFVRAAPSPLEVRESLEQLRGLELGFRYDVARVESVPLGVDTPEDLAKVCAIVADAPQSF